MLSNDFFKNLLDEMINLKGYFIIYFVLLSAFIISQEFFYNINFKGILFETFLLFLLGCLLLLFITKKDLPIHKVAFLIILIFGLCCVFLSPLVIIPDETEHFTRSELTSEGILFPNYINIPNSTKNGFESKGYKINVYLGEGVRFNFYGETIYQTDWDDQKINFTKSYANSAFEQNPFYGYIPQALGIAIAKLFYLNNIWMLWFGRLSNLIMYALICSYAIKKSPIYKNALLVAICMPVSIFQAASLSIDATVNALAFLTISYFLYLYKKDDNSINIKNLIIFSLVSLLCGFTKLTFLAFSLLIFLIPKEKFKNKKTKNFSYFLFLIMVFVSAIWSRYVTSSILHSYRINHFLEYNINAQNQLIYIFNNPINFFRVLTDFSTFNGILKGFFSNFIPEVSIPFSYWIMCFFIISFILFCLFYPNREKISNRTKLGLLFIGSLIYFGTLFIQYLTWTPIHSDEILGLQVRYFIPIAALAPMVISINNKDFNKFTNWTYIFIILFLSFIIIYICMNFY